MAVQRTNFANAVANTAGISLGNTAGTLTNAGSISEYAKNAAGNVAKIGEMAKHAAMIQENSADMSAAAPPVNEGGASITRSVLGAGAVLALGAIAPPLGAVAGVAMAIGEAVNFSIGHAAVNGAKGELTLASSAATFDKSGEMISYKPACEDVTYNVATGKPQAPMAPVAGIPNKLGAAVGQVAGEYDADQIHRDVKSMMDKETAKFGWAQRKLDDLGFDKQNGPDRDEPALANLTPDKPRPKALNVGMGAPSMG